MQVNVLKTFVRSTPKGMIVGNVGAEIDIPDTLFDELEAGGHVEASNPVEEDPIDEDSVDEDPVEEKPADKPKRGRKPAVPEAPVE